MGLSVVEPDPRSKPDYWLAKDATPTDVARAFEVEATLELVRLMKDSDSDAIRERAAEAILERSRGKAAAEVKVTHSTDDAARAALELAELRRNPKTAGALLVLAEASASMTLPPRSD